MSSILLTCKENSLNAINQVHYHFRIFLRAHSGFRKEDLPGNTSLFHNTPSDIYEKIDKLLDQILKTK